MHQRIKQRTNLWCKIREKKSYHLFQCLNPPIRSKIEQQLQKMDSYKHQGQYPIFAQLRHLFFSEEIDEQQIQASIRKNPIAVIEQILGEVIGECNKRLNEMIAPVQEQNMIQKKRNQDLIQKVQNYIQENEHLKYLIDTLEQQKKQSEFILNQSQQQFQKSRGEILLQLQEKKQKTEIMIKFCAEIEQENSQLKDTSFIYQTDLIQLKNQLLDFKNKNQKLLEEHAEMRNKLIELTNDVKYLKQQNLNLKEKNNSKDQMIATFLSAQKAQKYYEQTNIMIQNFHSFEKKKLELIDDRNFDLKDFLDDNNNEKITSSPESKQSKSCVSIQYYKQKRQVEISGQIQTEKIKMQSENKLSVEPKCNEKYNTDSKNIRKLQYDENSNGRIDENNQRIRKKTFSISYLHHPNFKSQIVSQNQNFRQIQCILRRKMQQIIDRNQKLEDEIKILKQNISDKDQQRTMLEGQYQLKIEDINEQLAFIKMQLKSMTEKYFIEKSLADSQTLELNLYVQEIENIKAKYEQKFIELKRRCKIYLNDHIRQVQNYCLILQDKERIMKTISYEEKYMNQNQQRITLSEDCIDKHQQSQSIESIPSFNMRQASSLEQIEQDIQKSKSSNLNEFNESKHETSVKQNTQNEESFKSNLDLQLNLKSKDPILIQQNFELFSDIGLLSDRFIDDEQKAIFTQRELKRIDQAQHIQSYKEDIKRRLSICNFIDEKLDSSKQKISCDYFKCIDQKLDIRMIKKCEFSHYKHISINPSQKREQQLRIQSLEVNQNFKFWLNNKFKIINLMGITILQNPRKLLQFTFSIFKKNVTNQNPKVQLKSSKFCYGTQTKNDVVDDNIELVKEDIFEELTNQLQQIKKQIEALTSIRNKIKIFEIVEETHEQRKLQLFDLNIDTLTKQIKTSAESNKEILKFKPIGEFEPICQISQEISSSLDDAVNNQIKSCSIEQKLQKKNVLFDEHKRSENTNDKIASYKIKSQPSNLTPILSKQLLSYSPLNNALLMSQTQLIFTDQNPQRKIKQNDQLIRINEFNTINFTPLKFIDEGKQFQIDNKIIEIASIPQQLMHILEKQQKAFLINYLTKKKQTLKFIEKIELDNFKLPKQQKNLFLILITKNQYENVYKFIIHSNEIICLNHKRFIKLGKQKIMNELNFSYGQSQVTISNGQLLINRKNKRLRLQGNLEDGKWKILSYLVCQKKCIY